MSSVPNPIRLTIRGVGSLLARFGVVDSDRVDRTVDLAWPRIVTGLARMSKNAVDIAMVGLAIGPAAIAGIGFAGPYWGAAFTIGSGIATGTIALVSQRYGAEAFDQLGQAVRSSVFLTVATTLPITVLLWTFSTQFIALLTNDPRSIALGGAYLRIVALGIPFAGLNLVGGRILIGADDAWTPMVLRASGAVLNIGLNALLIFGLGMGVVGAAVGTVLANLVVTTTFLVGLLVGRLPALGSFPVSVEFRGQYLHLQTLRDLVAISIPVMGRNLVWTGVRFPMLAFIALFGQPVVAAYIISRRIWALMNTPGWGFGLAASSLVGQSLGQEDEETAERYGHEIARTAVVTYAIAALVVFVFADPIVDLFIADPTGQTKSIAISLVYAACLAVVARGVGGTYAGALDARGTPAGPSIVGSSGCLGLRSRSPIWERPRHLDCTGSTYRISPKRSSRQSSTITGFRRGSRRPSVDSTDLNRRCSVTNRLMV